MPRLGRPAKKIELTAEERAELVRRIRAPTAAQRAVLRARIILESAQGQTAVVVAKALGVHSRWVERWRSRFSKSGLAGLEDRHRSGRKAKFSAVARCEIIAVACDPVITDKGQTSRTIENVMLQAIERGVVEGISWTSVQRILAEGEVRRHKVEGYLHSTDPFFRERVKEIVELHLHLPVDSVVLCIDEKPGMQALERRYPDRPAKPSKLRRREYEYKRHGGRFVFHYTPKHASWVNQVECFFSILERQSLRDASLRAGSLRWRQL